MKISVDELRGIGRWYLVLPPLLLVAFLIALYFLGATGQSRLEAANVRVHNSEIRDQALNDYLEQLAALESGNRDATKIDRALDRLLVAYRTSPSTRSEVERLPALTRQALEGATPAQTRATIIARINELRRGEIAELSSATDRWQSDLRLAYWISIVGTSLNIGLVILASVLVYADMRRRARQAAALRDQKQELGRQVDERTLELTTLSTHLQGVSEQEKSALSRELHDELGALLVAARMDLSWLQNRLPTSDPSIEQRFKRIHECLSAGVDLKRRVVEELRPTLLDNMGLFTALRWQFKESCRRAGLHCSETVPEADLRFNPDSAIAVFRIAQEAFTNILKHAEAASADLTIELQADKLVLCISDDGKGIPALPLRTATSHGLASMRHRILALGGEWSLLSPAAGGTILTAYDPIGENDAGGTDPLSDRLSLAVSHTGCGSAPAAGAAGGGEPFGRSTNCGARWACRWYRRSPLPPGDSTGVRRNRCCWRLEMLFRSPRW